MQTESMPADDRNLSSADRQTLMRCCTLATEAELSTTVAAFPHTRAATEVRHPETGLVMLRGRIGGDGAPFNVGEATVTRAVVRLQSGETGYAYMLGRSAERARLAAVIDAIGQSAEHRARLRELFVGPVMSRHRKEKDREQEKTAATRVDFFTLVRGED